MTVSRIGTEAQPIADELVLDPQVIRRSRPAAVRATLGGVLLGLLALEAILRPIAFVRTLPGGVREVRQYREGIAVAHFAADGARLTGAAPIAGGPNAIILGDSHVEALQVADAETMGAQVERIARSAGTPLNVRQYGWSGTAAPAYMAVADSLLARWQPVWVAVLLNADDLGSQALESARQWRMRIERDTSVTLIDARFRPPTATGLRGWLRARGLTPSALLGTAASHSALAHAAIERWAEIRQTSAGGSAETSQPVRPEDDIELIARASVRGLRASYGERLLIVFTGPPDASPTRPELALLAACKAEGVRCMPTRSAVRQALYEHGLPSRGFANTAPGIGHLNATGHAIVAELIWELARSRDPAAR